MSAFREIAASISAVSPRLSWPAHARLLDARGTARHGLHEPCGPGSWRSPGCSGGRTSWGGTRWRSSPASRPAQTLGVTKEPSPKTLCSPPARAGWTLASVQRRDPAAPTVACPRSGPVPAVWYSPGAGERVVGVHALRHELPARMERLAMLGMLCSTSLMPAQVLRVAVAVSCAPGGLDGRLGAARLHGAAAVSLAWAT